MIDVYFVRHGETGGNLAKRHQAEHTKLTEKGEAQALEVAAWAKDLPPTHLIASRHVRALQTAKCIGEATGLIPDTSEHFIELKRPRKIYGFKHRSVRSLQYLVLWYLGFVSSDDTDEAGESYKAFRDRLAAAQRELALLPDNSKVVIVSHAVFISFMVAHLCDKTPASLWQALRLFLKLIKLNNGSYTHVRFDPHAPENTCAWELVAYNVHAHIKA